MLNSNIIIMPHSYMCKHCGEKYQLSDELKQHLTECEDVKYNLFIINKEYLEKIFTKEELSEFKKEHDSLLQNDKELYIRNFGELYKNRIKMKYQLEEKTECTDFTLYSNIIKNNNIKIVWDNCLNGLKKLPSESVGLMVTSPPYYNAREYTQWPTLQKYLDDMKEILTECYRVLDNHRVFVFNISDVVGNDKANKINAWNSRKIPLPAYFIQIFEDIGFKYVDDIIWDKGEVQSSRHKNKQTPWPFYQYPINCYEHILIFHKHRNESEVKYPCSNCGSLKVAKNSFTYKGLRSWECENSECSKRSKGNRGKRFSLKTINTGDKVRQAENIVNQEIVTKWRRDICKLSPVIKINNKKENTLGHTAPFPMEIPNMAIEYFSYKGDVVLDMFAGSFTTGIAAQKKNRIGLGFELRKDLFEECIKKNITNHECEYEEL